MKRWIQISAGVGLLAFISSLITHANAVAWVLFFLVAFLTLFSLACSPVVSPISVHSDRSHTPVATPQQQKPLEEGLLWIPRTVSEVRTILSDKEFELFSAAVIMGTLGDYTFDRHCGGSGDHGVDVILRNINDLKIAVQSKQYASDRHVSSSIIREFRGSIHHHNCIRGYLVTTSTFTSDAREAIRNADPLIKPIDETQLARYLLWRRREIALAWQEIQEKLSRNAGNG